jgi:hypothetical protein
MPYVVFSQLTTSPALVSGPRPAAVASSMICCGVLPVCFSTASRYAWNDIVCSLSLVLPIVTRPQFGTQLSPPPPRARSTNRTCLSSCARNRTSVRHKSDMSEKWRGGAARRRAAQPPVLTTAALVAARCARSRSTTDGARELLRILARLHKPDMSESLCCEIGHRPQQVRHVREEAGGMRGAWAGGVGRRAERRPRRPRRPRAPPRPASMSVCVSSWPRPGSPGR